MITSLIIKLLVSAIVFYVLSKVFSSFEIKDFKTALLVAFIYGLLMAAGGLVALPLTAVVNFFDGLLSGIPLIGKLSNIGATTFIFLVNFITGSIMLWITDKLLKGFKMTSFLVGILVAFIISFINCFLYAQ